MQVKFIRHALFLLLLFLAGNLLAQPPAGLNFQATAKDNLGNPARNRTIYIKFAILQGAAAGGTMVYEETHKVQSNNDGIFTIIVGQGARTTASTASNLSQIDWAHGPFFYNMKMAVAPSIPASWWVAADNYIDFGTQQFMSVPFALFSGNASVTNVNTSIKPGPPNTFLITDSLGNVNWTAPQAAQVNVTQVTNVTISLTVSSGQFVSIPPNTTSLVKIFVAGVKKGDPVLVSALGDYTNWSVYNAWSFNKDTIAVRFANFTNAPVAIQSSQYKIVVIK